MNVYDIAFIDGLHTDEQVLLDFEAVQPHMAPKSVIVLHDVDLYKMRGGVERMSTKWQRHRVRGQAYKSTLGTMLLHRGFVRGAFDNV